MKVISLEVVVVFRMKELLFWYFYELCGLYKCVIVYKLGNFVFMYKSVVNCFKYDLKYLFEKSFLVYV